MRLLALSLLCLTASAQTPQGLWNATLRVNDYDVAFRMEFEGQGAKLRAALVDGDQRIWSTSGDFAGGSLKLAWNYFDSTLQATLSEGRLKGSYSRRTRAGVTTREFSAVPFQTVAAEEDPARGEVSGVWRIQMQGAQSGVTMDGRFRQSGGEVSGTIQRVDGDFGTLSGTIVGKKLHLSHFDGIRATLIEARITPRGTLEGVYNRTTNFIAARLDKAAELGIPEPPDPSRYVSVKNPAEPFRFRFMDLDGKWISTEEPPLAGKPVIVTIMGSWCPNCHDEAEVLRDLYREFHPRGLEIVALGFEYSGELERDRAQLRAFGERHKTPYTVLLAGATEDGEVAKKLPQIARFGGFPSTFYLDSAHKVIASHAGFAGPANVDEHGKLKAEMRELVERMLAHR